MDFEEVFFGYVFFYVYGNDVLNVVVGCLKWVVLFFLL